MKPSVNSTVESDVKQQPTCYQPDKMVVKFKMLKLLSALAMLSLPHVTHAQCPSIISDPAGPLCANEPVTFEVINLNWPGSVESWETSTDYFNGEVVAGLIGMNSNTIEFPEGFTEDTYIRAKLFLADCAYSQIFQITVEQPIVTNTISCDITEIDCSTTMPIAITGEQDSDLHAATTYTWQSYNGTGWDNIQTSLSPNIALTPTPVEEDVYIRRIINPVACDKDTSNIIHLPLVEYPEGGTIAGDSVSCVNDQPGTLTISGFVGEIATWEYSIDGISFSEIEGTINSTSYTPQNILGTHYYRVKVENGNCDPVYSNTVLVEIHPSITNYLITPNQHVCENEIPEDIVGNNPSGENDDAVSPLWVKREINETSWEIVPNQPDFIEFDAPLTTTTFYRRYLSGTYCESVSDSVAVFVSPLSDAGNFIGNETTQFLCPDAEATPIGITNFTGEIQDWHYAFDPNGEWTAIGHTDSIYNPENIPNEIYFKVKVKSEYCDFVWSEVYSILFYPEISNNTIGNPQTVCENTQPDVLQGSSPTGGNDNINFVFLWQNRTEFTEWDDAPGVNNLQDYTPQVIAEPTLYRRIVSSGDCRRDTSNTIEIQVDQPAETGNFSDSDGVQEICPEDTPETITIQNYTGTIVDWYAADQPEGPWTPLGYYEDEYTPPQTFDATYYKVGISSEFCGIEFSDVYSIVLHPEIWNNTISGDQTLCPGDSIQPLTGPLPQGANGVYDLLWQHQTEGSEWTDAPGTNYELDYTPTGLSESTFLRRLVFSGSCPSDTSNVVFIEQLEAPSGLFSGGGYYCPGEPLAITVNFNGLAPYSIQFNDGADTLTVDGITNNPHTITVTADTTTSYTLTHVWDANCASGDMAESSVEIIPVPEIGAISAGPDTSICGLNLNLSGSPILENFQTCTWTDDNGNVLAESPDFSFTSESPGEYELMYTVFSEACSDSTSSTVVVTTDVFEAAFAGGDQQICSTSTELNATPIEWGVGHWVIDPGLSITDPFDPLANLSDMEYGNTYSLTWFTESISGVCPMDSSSITISVDPLSDAGELNASADEICAGNEITFSLSGQMGDVNTWLFSDDVNGNQTINSDATTVESNEMTTDTEVAVVVQSGTCPPDTSNTFYLNVNPPTNPGTLSSDQQVCEGENEGTIEMNGFEGEILFWEYSSDNFQTSETIFSNQTSYAFQNLETTTQFRTNVQSGVCEAELSNVITVEVVNEILTPFELAEMYCSNDEAIDLNTLIDENASGIWTINGENSDSFNPTDYANSEVIISFTNNENFCGGTTSESTTVNTFPEVEILAPAEICGLNTEIDVASSAGSGIWTIGEELIPGGELNTSNLEIMALSYGAHQVTWTAENNGCQNEASETLTFFESPDAAEAGENQLLDFTYETRLDANQPEVGIGGWSSDNSSLNFSDIHDPNATVRNLGVGENNLRWTIANGSCPSSSSEVIVDVKGLIIPDAFSPNGDNVNDRYVIRGIDAIGPVSLKVWNRWGGIVHESTDYQNGWEGLNKNGNELPADTYYYLLKADGLNDVFKGFIVIQR